MGGAAEGVACGVEAGVASGGGAEGEACGVAGSSIPVS